MANRKNDEDLNISTLCLIQFCDMNQNKMLESAVCLIKTIQISIPMHCVSSGGSLLISEPEV